MAGNLNNWGSLSVYVASYFHNLNNSIRISDFVMIASIGYIAEAIYTIIFSYLFLVLPAILLIFIGVTICCTSLFFSSYILDPFLFCWVSGISLGILSSTIFLPSLLILWNVILENKGTTSGFILGGYSFGPVPFLLMFTYIANPNNYSATETDNNGEEKERYFGKDVSDKIPMTLRWSAVAYYIVCLIGIACLPKKWKKHNSGDQNIKRTMTVTQIIKNKKFWYIFAIFYFGLVNASYFQNIYRILGTAYINDDHFLAYVGSLSFIFAVFGRISFGIMLDKFSWKLVIATSNLFQAAFTIILYFTLDNRYFFGFVIILLAFLSTAGYSGALILFERVFPKDMWMFSYISLSFILNFSLPYFAQRFITPEIGYFFTFCIIAGHGFIAFILSLYPPRPHLEILNKLCTEALAN